MSVTITPFLRNVLYADAAFSTAGGLLMAGGASRLAPFLELPAPLLFWAGLALVPFVAMLILIVRRPAVSRLALIDLVCINALWATGSFALLFSGAVSPNLLGVLFVAAQALTVALIGALQFVGMRQASAVAA